MFKVYRKNLRIKSNIIKNKNIMTKNNNNNKNLNSLPTINNNVKITYNDYELNSFDYIIW